MSFLFPRVAFQPVRCTPIRHEVAPLWSLFDDTLNELQRASRQVARAQRPFNPRFDVKEAKDSFSLEGELPGINQKDISIEFTDENTLTIKGHRESYVEKGQRPEAQAVKADEPAATIEDGTATPQSEPSSIKSHQATVEDEEPASASATTVAKSSETAAPAQEVSKSSEAPKEPEQQYHYSERSFGSFSRSFNFPGRIDQEAVKASLKDGILSIVVPKAAAPGSRRIQIE